jgi:hypothetical protein
MIAEPMNPETRRQFDRWLWRERISRIMDFGVPVGIGVALFAGLIWLRSHGGPAWIGLTIAAAAALAKPALMVIRVLEKRRRRKKMD